MLGGSSNRLTDEARVPFVRGFANHQRVQKHLATKLRNLVPRLDATAQTQRVTPVRHRALDVERFGQTEHATQLGQRHLVALDLDATFFSPLLHTLLGNKDPRHDDS